MTTNDPTMPPSRTHDERWRSAAESFARFVPDTAPDRAAAAFARRLGPLGTFAFEAVGAMWDRPELSRRDRSLLVVSALAAQARDEELIGHTQIGLRHGLTRVEIEEILPMVAAYAGFPAAMAAARHIDEGLRRAEGVERLSPRTGAEPKDDDRRDADAAPIYAQLTGDAQLEGHAPDGLASLVERFGHAGEVAYRWAFGEVWARPELSPRDRSVVVLAILVSLGADQALRFHVAAARRNGLEPAEIEEAIAHLSYYAGLPRSLAASVAARDVLARAFA